MSTVAVCEWLRSSARGGTVIYYLGEAACLSTILSVTSPDNPRLSMVVKLLDPEDP